MKSTLNIHWKDWSWDPILWPPGAKSWFIGKYPDAGKDWGQEEKGMTEDEKVGWHHWLNEHGFEWTPGVGDGQGGLSYCSSWGRKVSDMTERLNWTGDVSCGFVMYSLYYVGVHSLYSHLFRDFFCTWMLAFVKCFFCCCFSLENHNFYSSFC